MLVHSHENISASDGGMQVDKLVVEGDARKGTFPVHEDGGLGHWVFERVFESRSMYTVEQAHVGGHCVYEEGGVQEAAHNEHLVHL